MKLIAIPFLVGLLVFGLLTYIYLYWLDLLLVFSLLALIITFSGLFYCLGVLILDYVVRFKRQKPVDLGKLNEHP